ncbi:MAG: PAS domain S-box protein [Algoriphagus sp.]|uniref:sensor histidine kinase n=1 Tax=Algoriphagus sp. TaxID=1872435 RepID=UPI002736B1DD|nr:PAS domain S-box protein [Algoriphagus sp.]MDP3471320.1 PAS domain S-box protein [Algoriphagus sp.]
MPFNSAIYKNSFMCSPDGIVVCNIKGEIVLVNQSVSRIFNFTESELVGQKIEIFIPEPTREKHKDYFLQYLANPVPRQMSNNMRLLGQKKDGSKIFLSISLNQISKEQGLFAAFIRDISEFVKKTDELEYTSLRLKDALDLSKLGPWDYDLVQDKLTWSDEVFKIFELDPLTYVPTFEGFNLLVFEDDREFVRKSFMDSITNQIPYNIVHRYICPNGDLKFLRERGNNIYNSNGEIIKTIGTVQDVTEVHKQRMILNEYVKKLEFKNKELEDLTYITTHDLQEPINNIKGIIGLMRNEWNLELTNKEDIENYFNLIENSSNRLSGLIKALMDTSRLGHINPITEVDCNLVLKEVLSTMSFQIKKSDAKIIFSELPLLNGFKFEIGLLFQNLISNGIKFSKKGISPIIKISCHNQGHSWLFMFEDNGIGIDPKHKDKLFRMFRRLHSQEDIEGTGIGLVQCKKIVEQHGGEIWIESELDKGTVFYFTLAMLPV